VYTSAGRGATLLDDAGIAAELATELAGRRAPDAAVSSGDWNDSAGNRMGMNAGLNASVPPVPGFDVPVPVEAAKGTFSAAPLPD
jgi:hypothetical protein